MPKGVMLTHGNLVANAFNKILACSLEADDVFLGAPAMFHVAGIAPLTGLTWLGGTTVTLPMFDPALCLDAIARHRVTIFLPVPTMLAALVAEQRQRPRDVSSLRMLGHAGSPIAAELIRQAHEVFPDSELAQFYGATETSSVVTRLRHEEATLGTDLAGSCGQPAVGVAVRTVRPDGADCEPGEVGEVLARSNAVTVGYWNNATATADALRDGWYHTGRSRVPQRSQLPVRRRPGQGHDRVGRRERLFGRGRRCVVSPSVGCRGGGVRSTRRHVGRGRACDRGSTSRHDRRPATSWGRIAVA